ncbi:hypothetical protein RhiirC2_740079 [Rhizophagus irregularis]|uniref:Uncharacterized protein n=1 Tax=Rhizophagus irregularis TaxID=588596 RepID=A0A2N1NIZ0_9GLOM|nr:hypothetical protein RhiirC2_740079 [Rhizophagus irregularis]
MYRSAAYFNKGAIGKPIVLSEWSLFAYHLGELLSWWSLYNTTKGMVNFTVGFTILDGPYKW